MNSDRGMKKWAPFSSLIEQATCLEKMRYEKNKIEKPKIATEVAHKINYILNNITDSIVEIKFYYNGYIYNIDARILRVNKTLKLIVTDKGNIPFSEILDIKDDNISNNIDYLVS